MAFINVSHSLQYSLSKCIKSPLFETPKVKIPRLSSSAMTSPASPSKWTHSSPRGPIWTSRCPNHSRHFKLLSHMLHHTSTLLFSCHSHVSTHPGAPSCSVLPQRLFLPPPHTKTHGYWELLQVTALLYPLSSSYIALCWKYANMLMLG